MAIRQENCTISGSLRGQGGHNRLRWRKSNIFPSLDKNNVTFRKIFYECEVNNSVFSISVTHMFVGKFMRVIEK